MKRITVILCIICVVMLTSVISVYSEEKSTYPEAGDYANSWRYTDGELTLVDNSVKMRASAYHPKATLKGIDVSEHQGVIDWNKVKAAGIDFAIIRCGYGMDQKDQDDAYFERNISECERLGIPYGVYLYSYATNTSRASSEADHVLRLIEGHDLAYPVYYDMEDKSTLDSDLAAIAKTFCKKISAEGYPVGVYSFLNMWNNYLTDPCFDNWYKWVAQWNTSCDYKKPYEVWQYTSDGSVSGINGRVDMNYLIGYPSDHGQKGLPSLGTDKSVYESGEAVNVTTNHISHNAWVGIYSGEYIDGKNYVERYNVNKSNGGKCTVNGLPEGEYSVVLFGNQNSNSRIKTTKFIVEQENNENDDNTETDEIKTVERIYGDDRYKTAYKVADELKAKLAVEKFDNIIIANGTNFADALAGSYLAAKKDAPILLTSNGKNNVQELQKYVNANINKGGTVYLLGGDKAVTDPVAEGLVNCTVERLAGEDRYATNLAILEEVGVESDEILVCTGDNFADSLSASASERPILLVGNKGFTEAQISYLTEAKSEKIYVIGGENAVSNSIFKETEKYASNVKRLEGATRYETSVRVAEEFFKDPSKAVVVYGQNFPDGLSGGPLAVNLGGPLILSKEGSEAAAAVYAEEAGITSGVVLGGPTLVSDSVIREIFQMEDSTHIIVK